VLKVNGIVNRFGLHLLLYLHMMAFMATGMADEKFEAVHHHHCLAKRAIAC
jgi:hypothetical protein